MNTLRLPASHPNSSVIQSWSKDKEAILAQHAKDIARIYSLLKTVLKQNAPQ